MLAKLTPSIFLGPFPALDGQHTEPAPKVNKGFKVARIGLYPRILVCSSAPIGKQDLRLIELSYEKSSTLHHCNICRFDSY